MFSVMTYCFSDPPPPSLPFSNPECRYLASSSKDGSIRIWDTVLGRCEKILTGHTQSVTCVKWGGDGLLYTSSQDRTVKVWRAKDVSVGLCLCAWLRHDRQNELIEWEETSVSKQGSNAWVCICGCRVSSAGLCRVTLTG